MSDSGMLDNEVLTWKDVDQLIDVLVPQIQAFGPFDTMIMITRGGIIPGGLIAESMNIPQVLTAAVDFPASQDTGIMAFPSFLQFPDTSLLLARKTLIVDDVWGSGRTSTSVRGRVKAAGGIPFNCVLHFNPYRSLFSKVEPDCYGAITNRYVIYPWELDRGTHGIGLTLPEPDVN